jgi:hypothetical protein
VAGIAGLADAFTLRNYFSSFGILTWSKILTFPALANGYIHQRRRRPRLSYCLGARSLLHPLWLKGSGLEISAHRTTRGRPTVQAL